jgi:hypothetical protein
MIGTRFDDYGNGKMQFYAQDAASSVADPVNFLNFTVDPDSEEFRMEKRPAPSNFVWHHKMGNLGFIGYSGDGFCAAQPLSPPAAVAEGDCRD